MKALLLDKEAAEYFVKLHIIAGQMSTTRMNATDTFYTLTGKSGEIFIDDTVRGWIFHSQNCTIPKPSCSLLFLCIWGFWKAPKNLFFTLCLPKLSNIGRSKWNMRQGIARCLIWVQSDFIFRAAITQLPAVRATAVTHFLEISAQNHISIPFSEGNGWCLF